MMEIWDQVYQIASTISYSDEEDALVWQFTSNGIYSSQSLYRIINFRGIKPILVPSVWNLKLPPRVNYFLWLVCRNKILTRDNLGKRKKIEDDTCLFCNEKERVNHLFFECVVAKQMWTVLSSIFYVQLSDYIDSVGKFWLSNKRNGILNMCTSAIWSLPLI